MDDTRPNRRLCMGWTLFLCWPVACTPVLLPYLLRQLDAAMLIIPFAVIMVIGVVVVIDILLRLCTSHHRGSDPTYPCPTCGADVEHTPHCCPSCGARLIWGHEPGPRDARSFRQQSIEH